MIFQNVNDIVLDDIFLELPDFVPGLQVLVKLEGLNPAGSIKLKTAVALVADAERRGIVAPGGRLIESSSGNLGVALSMVCAARGYQLTIVTDANANASAVSAMRALGTRVEFIESPDSNGGFLHRRIAFIHKELVRDPTLVWLNQYANAANPAAHRDRTIRSLHAQLPDTDVLLVGVGTSGTLMGVLEYRRRHGFPARVVAVDAEGSVTLGGPSGRRYIPGLGASRRPEIFKDTDEFEKILISELATVTVCREVARRYGFLAGGSTGSVLAAARTISCTIPAGSRIVVISPDLGDRYLDSIYSDRWVASRLSPELCTA